MIAEKEQEFNIFVIFYVLQILLSLQGTLMIQLSFGFEGVLGFFCMAE